MSENSMLDTAQDADLVDEAIDIRVGQVKKVLADFHASSLCHIPPRAGRPGL